MSELVHDAEIISVPEWCHRVGCSLDAGYRAARRGEIVGLFRIGRLMRVSWKAFVASTESGWTSLSQAQGAPGLAGFARDA